MAKRSRGSAKAKSRRRSSKRSQCEWVGGRFRLPFWVMEKEPYRPDLVLWLDIGMGLVQDYRLLQPDDPVEYVVDSLKEAMQKCLYPPTSVRVEDPTLAERLRAALGKETRVRVGPIPETETLLDMMVSTLGPGDEERSYLEGGRVSPEAMERFFRSAAALYRISPWEVVQNDGQIMVLRSPEFQLDGACLSVIGQVGVSPGFLVFDSIEDYARFAEYASDAAEEDAPLASPMVSLFSVNFEEESYFPQSMRAEIKEHGWEVAGRKAFPHILAYDEDGIVRPLSDKDVRFATACCRSLTQFLQKHESAFDDPVPDPVSELIRVEDLPGQASVRITFPHPVLELEALEEYLEYAAAHEAAADITEDFIEAKLLEGRGEEWVNLATLVLGTLYEFKIEDVDGRVEGWNAALVEEYLLEYFPQQVSMGGEIVEQVPDILDAFFKWLGAEGRISSKAAEAIGRRIAREREAFTEEARGPADRERAKSITSAVGDQGDDAAGHDRLSGLTAEPKARPRRSRSTSNSSQLSIPFPDKKDSTKSARKKRKRDK